MSLNRICLRAAFAFGLVLGAPELLAVPGSATAWAQASADSWRWSITPYLWGSGVQADVRFPAGQEIGAEAGFDDILDKLDVGGMLHVEGHRGEWGFFFDATYLSVSDDGSRGPIGTEADIDAGFYEFAAVYTPGGAAGRFSAFAGARIIDLSLDMKFTGSGPLGMVQQRSTDDSFTDFMVGGRYLQPLGDRWLLNLRGDVGGGDTESSWNVVALIGWRFGGDLDNAVLVGWRHMELEVENDVAVQTDVAMDGPIAGVLFGF